MPVATRRFRWSALLTTDRGALALLVLIFLGANWPLLTGQVSERWDGEDFFAPFYNYLASLTRSGHFLLWNPFSNGGSPDFAEPQVGAFSPLTLLFGLVAGPGPTAFHLYWLGVWLLGGLGMYVLARSLTAPPWGALVTALSFVFCGFYIGHAEHLSAVYTFSFVPWILWRVRAALTKGRAWPACEAGALWGLSALAGNPAVHIPAAMFIGLAALSFLPPTEPGPARWQSWRTYAVTMLLLAAVGTLVLAPTYLSFRHEVAGYSHRSLPLPRGAVLGQKFGFSWLTTLFTPVFVPYHEALPGWAEFDVSMRLLYFGSTLPVLAAFALWRQRRSWRAWTILGAGLLFLAAAMGSSLPVRTWLYDLVPPTRFFRHAAMFRAFFVVAVAMLAAPGTALLDACLRDQDDAARRLRPLALLAGTGALLAVASYVWISSILTDEIVVQVPAAAPWHLAVAWIGLAAVCLAAARRTGFRRYLPGALVALTALDLTLAYALTGHVAHQDKPSPTLTAAAASLTDLGPAGFARTIAVQHNANLSTHQPVFVSYTAMRNFYQENWGLDRLLRQGVLGAQRVWFTPQAPTVPASPEAYAAFQQRAHVLGALPVVRQTRAALLTPGVGLSPADRAALTAAPAAQRVDCQVLAYHADDLALSVPCPTDGFLLVTDRWSRSWEASVNGQPVPVDGGDFLFRLVPVKAGVNVVTMQFRVPWLWPLVALGWGTLAAVAGISLWKLRVPRKVAEIAPVGIGPALVGISPAAPAV